MSAIYVEFGNENGIEGYRDAESDDPDLVRYRPATGQRVTRLTYPDGMALTEAFNGTVTAIGYHLAEDGKPTWVESDSEGLKSLLCENYGVDPSRTRPKTWGQGPALAAAQTVLAHMPTTLLFTLSVLWAFLVARLASQELRTDAGDTMERVTTKTCKKCGQTRPLSYFHANPELRDGLTNECKVCVRERMAAYRARRLADDPVQYRRERMRTVRKNRYGMTEADYDAMLEAQGGGCAICGSPSPRNGGKTHLAVDHDHATGRVRGLLCDPCNNGLARFDDTPGLLRKAADYLGGLLMLGVGLGIFSMVMNALRTDSGRDYQARVMGDTASTGTGAYAPGVYIGLTANATAPAAGDTTLAGEVTTGTLARAAAIYAHTSGTASYTLTKTFTSDQSIIVAKIGVFTATTGGTMVFESLMNATATLVSGDQLQITETVTI